MKTPKSRVAISRWIGACAGVLMVAQMAGAARAATLTVPNEFEGKEANTFLIDPFAAAKGVEIQQLYDASQFAAFGSEGAYITSIGFRNETSVPYQHVVPDLEIRLSTTSRDASSLSAVVMSNFGPDAKAVFRGSFRLAASSRGETVTVPLTTPFFYRPSDGNLLFSFKNHVQWSSFPSPTFDTHIYPALSPFPVAIARDIPGEGGSVSRGIGVVAFFEFEAIPEPSTWSLAVIGLIACVIFKKRMRLRLARSRWIGMCAGLLMVAQMAGTANAATLTVPNEFENTEGNSFLSGMVFAAAEGVEFQQLFVSTHFAAFGEDGGFITGISFRTQASSPSSPYNYLIPDLEVRMSTSSREPSSLSSVVSANFGPDVATVYRGSFRLNARNNGETVTVPLTTPFFYRPRDGNFLFSFKNHIQWTADGPGARFDSHHYPGLGPFPIASALDIPGENGSVVRGIGLVAILQFEPVPEPTTLSLAVIGLIACVIFKKRMRLRLARSRWIGKCAGVLMVAQMVGTVGAATLTVPNEFEKAEGNTYSTVLPFSPVVGLEYQLLYVSSQFGAFGLEGALVTGIGFRTQASSPFSRYDLLIPDLEIQMSTTTREPSSLSPVLPSNFGADVTTVFRGQFRLAASSSGEIVTVPLTKPFRYRPGDGNLIFSLRNHAQWTSGPDPRFDAHRYPQSGPNPAGIAVNIPGEPPAAGGFYGLVTMFQFEAIPEPSTWSLAVIGLLACVIYKKRSHPTL